MPTAATIAAPTTTPSASSSSSSSANDLSTFFPHFLTLTVLIYLLGPSAACITLILSLTAIAALLLLRPSPFLQPPAHVHSLAVLAASSSSADLRSPQEVRAYYHGYVRGHEDGLKAAAVEEAADAFDDLRSEGVSTVRTSVSRKSRGGICGPAVVWKERPAFSASVGSGTPTG
ncbi:hypothetical protein FN846DRAFT_1006292 [Sphaerosporella brunnea]|uniref:Uncharacterized protein n=1 Tax=Sphaerosporella brunnea TaxID=1250544 RepID=A0A5J5F2C7_9PEZI|nr:hypothetical protein FN846DRAFT_1006292 [Sphaerosporella brunnea]